MYVYNMVTTLFKQKDKMYFALNFFYRMMIQQFNISCNIMPLRCLHTFNLFYTLCIFNYAFNAIVKYFRVFSFYCTLFRYIVKSPVPLVTSYNCFLDFNKELVT